MESKFIIGLIIASIILGILFVFIGMSFGLFDNIINWFENLVGSIGR